MTLPKKRGSRYMDGLIEEYGNILISLLFSGIIIGVFLKILIKVMI